MQSALASAGPVGDAKSQRTDAPIVMSVTPCRSLRIDCWMRTSVAKSTEAVACEEAEASSTSVPTWKQRSNSATDLVQKEDLGAADETASEGDELPLALGQILAAGLRRGASVRRQRKDWPDG